MHEGDEAHAGRQLGGAAFKRTSLRKTILVGMDQASSRVNRPAAKRRSTTPPPRPVPSAAYDPTSTKGVDDDDDQGHIGNRSTRARSMTDRIKTAACGTDSLAGNDQEAEGDEGDLMESGEAKAEPHDQVPPDVFPRPERSTKSSEGDPSWEFSSTTRLEKAVLGGLGWCSSCRKEEEEAASCAAGSSSCAAGLAAGESIPLSFPTVGRYFAVMEPLLHEEARAGVQVRMPW